MVAKRGQEALTARPLSRHRRVSTASRPLMNSETVLPVFRFMYRWPSIRPDGPRKLSTTSPTIFATGIRSVIGPSGAERPPWWACCRFQKTNAERCGSRTSDVGPGPDVASSPGIRRVPLVTVKDNRLGRDCAPTVSAKNAARLRPILEPDGTCRRIRQFLSKTTSGGMRQRLALERIMQSADNPADGRAVRPLDAQTRSNMQTFGCGWLAAEARPHVITHSVDEAIYFRRGSW